MAGRSYPRQLYLYAVDNNNDNNNIMCYSIFGGIFSQPRLTTGCIVLKPQKNNVKKKREKNTTGARQKHHSNDVKYRNKIKTNLRV